MSSVERKGGMARKVAALAAGALAAKFAMIGVEVLWTRGLKRDLPEMSDEESMLLKIAWIGLTAAAVGMARELARELTSPRVAEESA